MGARAPTPITVQHASQHVHRHTRRGRAVRDDKRLPHRERHEQPAQDEEAEHAHCVGKVGWSVERETWCRLTLERQPSAGAGLAVHQSRISIREIRASQTLDLLPHADGRKPHSRGGENLARARIFWEDGPPRPTGSHSWGAGGL